MLTQFLLLAFWAFFPFSYARPAAKSARLHNRQADIGGIVNTTIGRIQGKGSTLRSEVSAYLGIPFAQPPLGDLRFAAPVARAPSADVIQATAFGADCPCNRIPTHEAYTAGAAGQAIVVALAQTNTIQDEDCLSLNVWTKPQTGEANKAVLFWIYGGGFSTGNTACPIYDGAVLADENDVVVISINYRVNIFGFSAAPGQETNVGLLDQRLALEWTRDNIAAFGGDPNRITVFGQSAGGASADIVGYGWPDDPIAHALILQSGVANSVIGTGTTQQNVLENWYDASKNAGCGGEEAGESTVACMKTKTWEELLDAIEPLGFTGLQSGFAPFADDKVIPNNLEDVGEAGEFAHLPVLVGNTNNEASFFVVVGVAYTTLSQELADTVPTALFQPILDIITLSGFTCPASQAVDFRTSNDIPVWRYMYYGGNYSNTYINPLGSNYHTSELPLLFGTTESVTGQPDTQVEAASGAWMRNAWTTFAKDPVNGLTTSLGWEPADAGLPYDLAQLSLCDDNQTGEPSYAPSLSTDWACPVLDTFSAVVSSLPTLVSNLFDSFVDGDTETDVAWQMMTALVGNNSNTFLNDADSLIILLEGLSGFQQALS